MHHSGRHGTTNDRLPELTTDIAHGHAAQIGQVGGRKGKQVKNRQSAAKSRHNRDKRCKALAADVHENQLSLASAEASLEWELAGNAAIQVQIEEILKLRASLKALQLTYVDKK